MNPTMYPAMYPPGPSVSGGTAGGLLTTGQTTSYHAGDDGALQKGLARDFELMIAGQYAGTTNITINSKTCALSNNCTKDHVNNLEWSAVPQSDIGPAGDGVLFWEQYAITGETCTFDAAGKTITADAGTPFSTAALCGGRIFPTTSGNNPGPFTVAGITSSVITVSEAVVNEASVSIDLATTDDLIWNFADQANANSLGGHSDWYVPNLFQLFSIVDISEKDPHVDTTVFPSTPTGYTWMSSVTDKNPTYAARLLFSQFYFSTTPRKLNKYNCRLVRDL